MSNSFNIYFNVLFSSFFQQFEILYKEYLEYGFKPIKLRWESYAVSLGTYITARTLNGEIYGFANGITDEGVLLIEDKDGNTHQVYSADIEISSSQL